MLKYMDTLAGKPTPPVSFLPSFSMRDEGLLLKELAPFGAIIIREVGVAVVWWIIHWTSNLEVARSIPTSLVFWMKLKTKISSPYDLVVGGTFNPSSLTHSRKITKKSQVVSNNKNSAEGYVTPEKDHVSMTCQV